MARRMAAECYEKQALELLTLQNRKAQLIALAEIHQKEADALDRPMYFNQADDPHFLLTYFTSNDRHFSLVEEKKYQQVQITFEKTKLNQHLIVITDIEIELQEMKHRHVRERKAGRQPDLHEVERMNYLLAWLQLLQAQDAGEPLDIIKPKAARGPRKKCSFGYHASVELLGHIVDDLKRAIGFLRSPTTTDDFIKVATTQDLATVGIVVLLGCQNTQLIYAMEYFNSIFSSFDAATIGNSGLFFSRKGNLLKSHNLNNTSCGHVHQRYAIDAIFKKYRIPKS